MAKSLTPGPRQFTLQTMGATIGNTTSIPPWQAMATSLGTSTYWTTNYADLRGLVGVESKSLALSAGAINLQEASDIFINAAPDEFGWCWAYDMLTTVPLSEDSISRIGHSLITNAGTYTPGFLQNTTALGIGTRDPEEQTLNPSQIVWGSWRFFASNGNFRMADENATQVVQSGLFGQGDYVTSNALYYTRIFILDDNATSITIPSANLVIWGSMKDITVAEEMTSMMRAYQR